MHLCDVSFLKCLQSFLKINYLTKKYHVMKKQMILLVSLVAMVFTLNATSINPVIVSIKKSDDAKALEIRLANLEMKNTQISILDAEGKSWYFHNVSKDVGYSTKLNLEGMPDNDYVVFVKNKKGQHFQAFSMEGEGITFFQFQNAGTIKNLTASLESYEMKDAPRLITKVTPETNRSLNVRVANLKKAPTTLRLFSDSGTKIQTVKVANEHAYAKNWDLQNVADGNYFLYIESENSKVVQSIKVKGNNVEIGEVQRLDF